MGDTMERFITWPPAEVLDGEGSPPVGEGSGSTVDVVDAGNELALLPKGTGDTGPYPAAAVTLALPAPPPPPLLLLEASSSSSSKSSMSHSDAAAGGGGTDSGGPLVVADRAAKAEAEGAVESLRLLLVFSLNC